MKKKKQKKKHGSNKLNIYNQLSSLRGRVVKVVDSPWSE